MLKYIFSLWSLFIVFNLPAQNLVPNYSAESYMECPFDGGTLFFPSVPPEYIDDWTAPTSGSSDFFNVCSSAGAFSVPDNFMGYQEAHTGEAYLGIYCMWVPDSWWDYREYIQVKLSQEMSAGHRYVVSYWISLGELYSNSGMDQMGVAFLPDSVEIAEYYQVLSDIEPQVESEAGTYFSDTDNWMRISDTFEAEGNERWMILGNFNAYTDVGVETFGDTSLFGLLAYYFYDDICVLDLDSDSGAVGSQEVRLLPCGDTMVLYGRDPGDIHIWDNGDTGISRTITDSGIYWVKTIDLGSCAVYMDTFIIQAEPTIRLPLDLGNDTTLCTGDIILDATLDMGMRYTWSTGDTTATILVNTPGIYYVFAVKECYYATDTIEISDTMMERDLFIGNDTAICERMPLMLDASREVFYQYIWNTGDTTPLIHINEEGRYYVFASGECFYGLDTVVVSYQDPPMISPINDTVLCNGVTIQLKYEGQDLGFLWSTGEGGCCKDISEQGTYIVTAEDVCGDQVSDTVSVLYSGCDICVTMPNAFSPNGDGVNDIFAPVSDCIFKTFTMDIYNRWGERVFISYDVSKGWDGTIRGENADVGVYYYIVTAVSFLNPEEEVRVKGDLTLLR